MKVYALVGKSGTGKSYQAMNVCRTRNIVGIIDDGLFIYNNDVVAGISAKRQPTVVGAIKTALISHEDHKSDVAKKLKTINPESLLIIGTSDAMVERIRVRLELPEFTEVIYIEDITTEKERDLAKKQRFGQGKHVVPVPSMKLKRHFSGYFVDSLRIFRGWGPGKGGFTEKSVVRPTYSYLGEFKITDKVISDIVELTALQMKEVAGVLRVITENKKSGLRITILVNMGRDSYAVQSARLLQIQCAQVVESMTAFNIKQINVEIRGLA
jgi:uncharacterized alkaline shock family protein YloU